MGIASSDCCDSTLGIFGSNWIWIIILILIFCCGFGRDRCGSDGILGAGIFGGNCSWIWILLILFCFCGNKIF